jgi:hypothetical protein
MLSRTTCFTIAGILLPKARPAAAAADLGVTDAWLALGPSREAMSRGSDSEDFGQDGSLSWPSLDCSVEITG